MTTTLSPSQQLRQRCMSELDAEQLERWKAHYGRPVSYWRSNECEAALADPFCISPPERAAGLAAPPNGKADAGAQLAALIQQVAAGAIDEDRVRAIVDEATRELASEQQVRELATQAAQAAAERALAGIKADRFEVVVNGSEPRSIQGRPHKLFERVLKVASSFNRHGVRRNCLLVGPTQCGKSTLGEQIAEALGLRFGFLNLTEGVSEVHFSGRFVPTGEAGRFQYVPSQFADFYENGGVFVLDEIDSADPNVLLAINNAIANGHMAVNDPAKPQIKRHKDFVLLACANTWGHGADRDYVGRNQLDAATLARFSTATFHVDYDPELEYELADYNTVVDWAHQVRAQIRELKIRRHMTTKWIVDAADQIRDGISTFEQMKAMYFQSWTADERYKLGALAA